MSECTRVTLPGSVRDRLFFAQVREDPALEIEILRPVFEGTIIVVSSGGCTALSLLAAGASRVIAVDSNITQNHLVELKMVAVALLGARGALDFLGGLPAAPVWRQRSYRSLRAELSVPARAFWDRQPRCIGRGVLTSGVSERFIAFLVRALRILVHPRQRMQRLLACESLEEQRVFFEREWNTRRWRAFFEILLNRRVLSRAYNPAFFEHVRNPSFAAHFRRLAEHALTEIPVAENYFLHQMLTGFYPASSPNGVPPYLTKAGASAVRHGRGRAQLVDGQFTEYLRSCEPATVSGFALSNICEWLSERDTDELFGEIARVAMPGARLCFRNFVGWTTVPERWRPVFEEDRALGDELIGHDRSVVQCRFVPCAIQKAAA